MFKVLFCHMSHILKLVKDETGTMEVFEYAHMLNDKRSASTEAFIGTVCVIGICRSFRGEQLDRPFRPLKASVESEMSTIIK